MRSDAAIRRYRRCYAALLRLYPRGHRARYAEPMEQTFHDALCHRAREGRPLLPAAMGMCADTIAAIIRQRIATMKKTVIRPAVITAALLMVPLVGMQSSQEVNWSIFDFVIAGAMLFGTGFCIELALRRATNSAYKLAAGLALVSSLALIWANLAVGIVGSEDNPINVLYYLVLCVGFLGAIMARLQPRGMSRTLFAMAAAQVVLTAVAMVLWQPKLDTPEHISGVVSVLRANAMFVTLFVGAGLLFRQAATPDDFTPPGAAPVPLH